MGQRDWADWKANLALLEECETWNADADVCRHHGGGGNWGFLSNFSNIMLLWYWEVWGGPQLCFKTGNLKKNFQTCKFFLSGYPSIAELDFSWTAVWEAHTFLHNGGVIQGPHFSSRYHSVVMFRGPWILSVVRIIIYERAKLEKYFLKWIW